jgi:hypothetical protein
MNKRDEKAPEYLEVTVTFQGKQWGHFFIPARQFKTGSVGYFGVDRVANPDNPVCKYSVNMIAVLLGSKPGPAQTE